MGTAKSIKKVLLYSPYLNIQGGGERYFLTIASILSMENNKVDIAWSGDPECINISSKRFGLDLKKINIIPIDISKLNIIKKFFLTRKYDISLFINDGSIPFMFSKQNLLHIQVPFNLSDQYNILNFIKLFFIKKIICNSVFTEKWVKKTYHSNNTIVLYPPVDTSKFKNKSTKLNQILSISRFSESLNSKRQDILIEAFKMFSKSNKDYKLILAGASDSDNKLLDKFRKISKGYPISFKINPSFQELIDLYAQSKIFWHAAGFGIDENNFPEKTEHFGIVLVEAIAAGCIVFAVDKGGVREIITDGNNGFLYTDAQSLVRLTSKHLGDSISKDRNIDRFSIDSFKNNLLKILN